MHPLPAIMNHGVPVALCSDDPSAFGNMGLSFDFFQVSAAGHAHRSFHRSTVTDTLSHRCSSQAKSTGSVPCVSLCGIASR